MNTKQVILGIVTALFVFGAYFLGLFQGQRHPRRWREFFRGITGGLTWRGFAWAGRCQRPGCSSITRSSRTFGFRSDDGPDLARGLTVGWFPSTTRRSGIFSERLSLRFMLRRLC